MGRKKKKTAAKSLIFCYYCGRKFKSEKELIAHQRAVHFKCPTCHKRFNSARGLQIHCFTVHKEAIQRVPGVPDHMDTRSNFDVEILGMQGVPSEAMIEALEEEGLIDEAARLKSNLPNKAGIQHGQVPPQQPSQFPPAFPGMPGFPPMHMRPGMFPPHLPPPTNPMLQAPRQPQFQPQFTGPNAAMNQPPQQGPPSMPQPPSMPSAPPAANGTSSNKIAAPPGVTAAPSSKKKVNRIYDIEGESMEERRASLNQYRFNANLASDVSRLSASISSRLHNVQGGYGNRY